MKLSQTRSFQQHKQRPSSTANHRREQSQHIFVSSRPIKAQQTSHHQLNGQQTNSLMSYADDSQPPPPLSESEAPSQPPTEEEPEEFECPNNGIFADVASGCQSYHVCQSGAQVQEKFQCPLGTLFNNIILTCDFAHNVQCSADKSGPPVAPPVAVAAPAPPAPRPVQQAPQVQPFRQQQHPNHHHQQPQRPRASAQVNQQTLIRPPPAATTPAGPRQLVIGNAQRPPQQVNFASNSNDDDDDDQPEPLVPAKLPVRPPTQTTHSLPYLAPPPATRQTAHLSQYPRQQQPQQQQHAQPASHLFVDPNMGNFDGASSASPVFAGRDEPATTEPASVLSAATAGTQATSGRPTQAFSMVINHVTHSAATAAAAATGGQHQPASSHQNKHINYKQNELLASFSPAHGDSNKWPSSAGDNNNNNRSPKPRQMAPPSMGINQQVNKVNPNKLSRQQVQAQLQVPTPTLTQAQVAKKQQQQQVHTQKQPNKSNKQVYNQRYEIQRAPKTPTGQQVNGRREQANYVTEASQPTATHQPQQHATGGGGPAGQPRLAKAAKVQTSGLLVDLTNDHRQASSVGSEALNDGLLLIVRHSPSAGPIKVGGSAVHHPQVATSASGAISSSSNGNHNGNHNKAKSHKSVPSSQAFAVDPNLISPNSPVDAHLFPNVQRVLAAGSSSNGHHDHHHHQQQHLQRQFASAALPGSPQRSSPATSGQRQEQVVAASASQPVASTTTLASVASSKPAAKTPVRRVRRAKRLRAAQEPTATKPATPTTTTTTKKPATT